MADKKISDFTALAAIAAGDLIEVETSGGNSRKVKAEHAGIAQGTSFPGSPTSGDRIWRSDRNIEYYYDGTRWLSTQIFSINISMTTAGVSVDSAVEFAAPYLSAYDVMLISWDTLVFRNAAGEWDIELYTKDASGTTTLLDTQDGSADATSTYIHRQRALTNVLQTSTTKALRVVYNEISGTATLIADVAVNYRLIG